MDRKLAHVLPTYTHPAVLVVDEVGYLTNGTDAGNMLVHVVNERHRRHRPMIFTGPKVLQVQSKGPRGPAQRSYGPVRRFRRSPG